MTRCFHEFKLIVSVCTAIWLMSLCGCKAWQINTISDRLAPSNDRNWSADLAVLPSAEFVEDEIKIKNIRNINYLSEQNFVVKHYDRRITLDEIRGVDFVVTPFNETPLLAHTMLSFELSDGSYIGVSVEVRKELGESYSPVFWCHQSVRNHVCYCR